MNRPLALAGIVLALGGLFALGRAASEPDEGARVLGPEDVFQRDGFPVAARSALGRRVLWLRADPGSPLRRGAIAESGRGPGGWALYPPCPPGVPAFAESVEALQNDAARTWDRDRGFPADVADALALYAVKVVLVDDKGKGAKPLTQLERAEPVMRTGARDTDLPNDPVSLAARLRATPARESDGWTATDWEDTLWGGAVTVTTDRPARFVFPYPAAGARVLVNGAAASPVALGALLGLDLPAGASRVEVTHAVYGPGRTWALAGGAGLLAGLIALLLSVRPSRASLEAADAARAGKS